MNWVFATIFLLSLTIFGCQKAQKEKQDFRPRLLVTTDIGGDPDDMQSLTRLLYYANEFELEGLVASASGTIGELDEAVVRPDLIKKFIEAYRQVQPNLVLHDKNYPEADSLLALVKAGNPQRGLEQIGEEHLTEGAEWIIKKVDESARPLNVAIWGGQTDFAQALWQVKNERTKEDYNSFIAKLRVHDIADQDSLFPHIKENHPALFYILNRASLQKDKREAVFRGMYLDGKEELTSLDWLKTNVIEDHGPLGALYPQKTWTAPNPYSAMKEGDTPSWFYFLLNGLNVPEHPEYGGWGGRFEPVENEFYNDAIDTWQGNRSARITVARWREDFQNAFAARMDWGVKKPEDSNHAPIAVVDGDHSKDPLKVKANAGETLKFNAAESYDPEGNQLKFEWMIYPEAGDLQQNVNLNKQGAEASLIVPDLNGQEVHVITKVIDDGKPPLVSYKRIIITNE